MSKNKVWDVGLGFFGLRVIHVFALMLSLGAVTLYVTGVPQVLVAQEPGDEMLEDVPETTPSAPAAPPTPTDSGRRTLLDSVWDGGFVGLCIIILSMVSVGFIVEHLLTIRKSVLMPEHVIDELDELVAGGKIDEAIEACQTPDNQSLFANVVLAGLERYKGSEFGFAEYKAAVEEAGEDQTGYLYRKTEVLGVIGSISPMLGLMGTVLGMIRSFNTIAASGGMARPDELAGGIGQALVTTLMGLIVAIPTMIAFSYFRNRIDSLVAEAGKRVEQVLMPLGRRKN
jgi:biopolymer transport protein ExbB